MNIKYLLYAFMFMTVCGTSISMEQEQLDLAWEKLEWKKECDRVQLAIKICKLANKLNYTDDLPEKRYDIILNSQVLFAAQRTINKFFCNGQSAPPSPNKLPQYKQNSPILPRSASFSGSDQLLEPLEQGYQTA